MKSKYLWSLIVLSTIAVAGLIVLQVYWVNNTFILREQDFSSNTTKALIKVASILEKEEAQIKKYFGTKAEMEAAEDPLGFYWVDRSETAQGKELLRPGDLVALTYKGEYLTGRFLEKSPEKFELAVGTPDQLLKGLNYVISRLKLGENAKIILPSRLAFGENGSSNGMVPPFTPLVYEIKILEHKKNSDPAD